MWAIDHRGGLVNLDNAVWIGLVDAQPSTNDEVEGASLAAHMVDGTTVTLRTGPKDRLAPRLWEYAERLMLGETFAPTRLEIEAQMRYGGLETERE